MLVVVVSPVPTCSFQRLLEWPEDRFSWAVEKGIAVAAFMGKLSKAASSAVKTIVDEASMPNSLKSIPMVVLGGSDQATGAANKQAAAHSGEQLFYHNGLLLRVVQGCVLKKSSDASNEEAAATARMAGEGWSVIDFGDQDMVQRKIVGHEMRGLRLVTECSTLVRLPWGVRCVAVVLRLMVAPPLRRVSSCTTTGCVPSVPKLRPHGDHRRCAPSSLVWLTTPATV